MIIYRVCAWMRRLTEMMACKNDYRLLSFQTVSSFETSTKLVQGHVIQFGRIVIIPKSEISNVVVRGD